LSARRAQLYLSGNINVRVSEFVKLLAANHKLTQVFCEHHCSRCGNGFVAADLERAAPWVAEPAAMKDTSLTPIPRSSLSTDAKSMKPTLENL